MRLNFIFEVKKIISLGISSVVSGNNEYRYNQILHLLIVLAIMTKKYLEDSEEDTGWIDIEQELFNLVNNLINRKYTNYSWFCCIFFYSIHLINLIALKTHDLDNYINIEKFISKIKFLIQNYFNPQIQIPQQENSSNFNLDNIEMKKFVNVCLNLLGTFFDKTDELILSKNIHQFTIELIFTSLVHYQDFILENFTTIKNSFKNFNNEKNNKNNISFVDETVSSLILNENYKLITNNMDTFYKYLNKYTTDVTAGKKIWKHVEDFLNLKISNATLTNLILEMIIIFIFNKSKFDTNNDLNLPDDGKEKNLKKHQKINLTSIFEFLCEKFSSTHVIIMPSNSKIPRILEKNNNLNLFYEIISNHYDVILTDQILNERYMLYFARIFFEDTLVEFLENCSNNSSEKEEKLLLRLSEIISNSKEPLKLFVSLFTNLSKIFHLQINVHYPTEEQINFNYKFLDKFFRKLILFLTKYSNFHLHDKDLLDKDEVMSIINNFSNNKHELKYLYIQFYVKFLFFIEFNYKIELEFIHKKKIYVTIFEFFCEIILHYSENLEIYSEEYIKMIELLIILMKNHSKHNLEDGYLIYRMMGIILNKFSIGLERENSKFNSIQLILTYQLTCLVVILISG